MAQFIYLLCAFSSLLCAILLIRGYFQNPSTLLLWSAICFFGLASSNIILVIDLVFLPVEIDLAIPRTFVTLLSLIALIYGLIWDGF